MTEQRPAEQVAALVGPPTFTVDGRAYTLPPQPMSTWLQALADESPDAIVPALLPTEHATALYDRLTDTEEPLDPDVCQDAGRWVVEELTGRAWWEVGRLASTALLMWNLFDGWCGERGIDPMALPLRRFCNLFHRHVLATIGDAEALEAWQAWLVAPPNTEVLETRPEWGEDAMDETFAAVFAEHQALTGPASQG